MANDDKTKERLFGVESNTPGQNIHHRVIGGDSSIGIPPWNYPALMSILQRALKPEEVDLICRGFGLLRPRQIQKEIAATLGISNKEVSTRAHKAIGKLKKSPYKSEIKKLALKPTELFDMFAKLEATIASYSANHTQISALEHQLANAQAQLKATEDAKLTLEGENATLKRDLNRAEGMLSEAQRVNGVLQDELVETMEENFVIKSINEQYEAVFTRTLDSIQKIFHGTLSKVKPKASSIVAFGFSETATKELSRVNLTTISALRRQSKHSLSKLRVSQATIREIVEKLAERGLSLRA